MTPITQLFLVFLAGEKNSKHIMGIVGLIYVFLDQNNQYKIFVRDPHWLGICRISYMFETPITQLFLSGY